MKFTAANDLISSMEKLKIARAVWKAHPMRNGEVDKTLEQVSVVLQPSSHFGLNTSNDPIFRIGIPEPDEFDTPNLSSALTHELTHIIDRHDLRFTGSQSSKEIDAELGKLPDKKFASVLWAFNSFWNAYIDGRLERRGMAAYSMHDRLAEKIGGSRLSTGWYEGHEVAALSRIWCNEPHTFSELTILAWIFPYYRIPKYRYHSNMDGT